MLVTWSGHLRQGGQIRHNTSFVPTPGTADRFLGARWRRGTTQGHKMRQA
jgi:hypothetical protein